MADQDPPDETGEHAAPPEYRYDPQASDAFRGRNPALPEVLPGTPRVPVLAEEEGDSRRAVVYGYGPSGQHVMVGIEGEHMTEGQFYAQLGRLVFHAAQGKTIPQNVRPEAQPPTHLTVVPPEDAG